MTYLNGLEPVGGGTGSVRNKRLNILKTTRDRRGWRAVIAFVPKRHGT